MTTTPIEPRPAPTGAGTELEGLRVVVTGAGSGLGRAIAVDLAAAGCLLVLAGRRIDPLLETAEACRPHQVTVRRCDIAQADAAAELVEATVADLGGLDAVINNAGLARFGALATATSGIHEQLLATNLIGPAQLIRAAVEPLSRHGRGSVVNIGSVGGLLALPHRAAYGASKAALHHLTRSLARELAPHIRVNAIAPGAIDTPMYDDLGLEAAAVDQLRRDMIDTTPLGRMGRPEEVAPWVRMLLGPAGSFVTGSLIVVDGGRSC